MSLDLAFIRAAHDRIRSHVVRTPVRTSAALDSATGGTLFFKCENLQAVGAFKARGATNAILSLTDAEAAHGVATHSSGTHAAAVARAAGIRGIPAYIVMPSNSAKSKIRNVENFGGRITFCEPTNAAREAACARLMAETGATLIHPFNDYRVMAGQGTAALELLADHPDLDQILCPVGGGGLLCGTAVAAKSMHPAIRVIATEPAGADDAARSLRAGRIIPADNVNTLADGLRTTIGEANFPIIQRYVDDIVTVSEASIVTAMRELRDALGFPVEPSSAVPYAAIREGKVPVTGRRTGIILTGGNVDI